MSRALILMLPALALLAGCADVPELDARITPAARTAPFPALAPITPVIEAGLAGESDEMTAEQLRARAARLQARANSL
ncbi:MAG: hypothetical protein ACI9KS_000475 [Sulfitobacter sp.]|jgi:hypothetical protein